GVHLPDGTVLPVPVLAPEGAGCAVGSEVAVSFPPRAVSVHPAGARRQVVDAVEPHGAYVRVHAGEWTAEVSEARALELALEPGVAVEMRVDPDDVRVRPGA